jgi:hypothetical protein
MQNNELEARALTKLEDAKIILALHILFLALISILGIIISFNSSSISNILNINISGVSLDSLIRYTSLTNSFIGITTCVILSFCLYSLQNSTKLPSYPEAIESQNKTKVNESFVTLGLCTGIFALLSTTSIAASLTNTFDGLTSCLIFSHAILFASTSLVLCLCLSFVFSANRAFGSMEISAPSAPSAPPYKASS